MHYLFEKSDALNTPIECFIFDAATETFPVRPHWHYFCEIIYLLDGNAEMRCDNDTYFMNSGDMIVFSPKKVHSIFAASTGPLKYIVLKFDINKFNQSTPYAPKLRTIFKQAAQQGMAHYFSVEISKQMQAGILLNACLEELKEHKYGYDLLLQNHIYTLLMTLVRHWLENGLSIHLDATENDYDIDSITEYIDSCMTEELRVSDIARKCGMSYSNFAKKFQENYGMSCKEYIEQMRIFKVEEFLLFTDHTLNYICQETGFSDCSHLIKSFKQLRGMTPKQFKHKYQTAHLSSRVRIIHNSHK